MTRRSASSKSQAINLTGLLNFQLASPVQHQETPRRSNNYNHRGGSYNNYNNHGNNNRRKYQQQQYLRSAQDRTSARRKAHSAMFYLHASADHSFWLSRRLPPSCGTTSTSLYTFTGADTPISWECVLLVQQWIAADEEPACPICLSEWICPRITKCGHVFCLPCLLRHIQSSQTNNPYQPVKCPCCGIAPLIVSDVRPVTVQRRIVPRPSQSFAFIKLHRYKDCPTPFLPLPTMYQHLSPHSAPCSSDPDASYSRFVYVDPQAYQDHLKHNYQQLQEEYTSLMAIMAATKGRNHHVQGDLESMFVTMALDIVQQEQDKFLSGLPRELELQEQFANPSSGIYHVQSQQLIYNNQHLSSFREQGKDSKTDQGAPIQETTTGIASLDSTEDEEPIAEHGKQPTLHEDPFGSYPPSTISSGWSTDDGSIPSITRRLREDSISSQPSVDSISSTTTSITAAAAAAALSMTPTTTGSPRRSSKSASVSKRQENLSTSMYLDDGAVHFYQSVDGQIVFLHGFNMTCLSWEFNKYLPTHEDQQHDSQHDHPQPTLDRPPLPDQIEGIVVELETIHLTPEVRKRMPFLSHLPLYMDVTFVELDLNHLLSESTKQRFKAEFIKRRKRRQAKLSRERREDRALQAQEEERIQARKAKLQIIDPIDPFFHVQPPPTTTTTTTTNTEGALTGDEFGPSTTTATTATGTTTGQSESSVPTSVSFAQACSRGHLNSLSTSFPALGGSLPLTATAAAASFPALGSSPPTRTVTTTWGNRSSSSGQGAMQDPLSLANPPTAATSGPTKVPVDSFPGGKKKKGKGQKIVLFSTAGQRGSVF